MKDGLGAARVHTGPTVGWDEAFLKALLAWLFTGSCLQCPYNHGLREVTVIWIGWSEARKVRL